MSSIAWSAAALAVTALLMGTTLAHVLEMPAKMKVDGRHWVGYQHTLYRSFATIGGATEIAAIGAAAAAAFLLRGDPLSFGMSLTAAVALAVAFFVVWIFVTNDVNRRTARWDEAAVPADWERWRKRWEVSHAARFALHLLGFVSLALALLAHRGAP